MFAKKEDLVPFDYCVIAGGCNFNQFAPTGESPWFPTVHECNRATPDTARRLDERFLGGRRRRIYDEHYSLCVLNARCANVLIVGAGYAGVEWACELQHAFPQLQVTLTDFRPRCLDGLPQSAADYCEEYMCSKGVRTCYGLKYDPENLQFWSQIGLPRYADKTYILAGVQHSNYFMPRSTLSEKGPGGGGWIMTNKQLQVTTNRGELYGGGSVFAVGDCTIGCVGEAPYWDIPPIPKTGYPAEQQAIHACSNIHAIDRRQFGGARRCCGCCCFPRPAQLRSTWYPWGSGIYAISLGPSDGCVVVGVNWRDGSGRLWSHGLVAAAEKELIGTTKVAQCRGNHWLSREIWHAIHHWPVNLWGRGPLLPTSRRSGRRLVRG